ncbi:glycosyltransferase family 69 protein [Athelia psychrophila]|uniref:Glycosyltransferase family 69 protein n=1 Tax=Athelia psychrophila TaxID=1759441 RepID=A0A165XUJ8_9AGAM|nr:glycosyltransferase family 69 protein [Fibularhizoctonia sp. CBS 109695]
MLDQKHHRSRSSWVRAGMPVRSTPTRVLLCIATVAALLFLAIPFSQVDRFNDVPPPPSAPPFVLSASRVHPNSSAPNPLAPLARLVAPSYRPECVLSAAHRARYSPLAQSATPVFLALNLLDAQWPLATLLHELPTVLRHLGPDVFVSVLENGSTDRTPGMLGVLANLLDVHGVAYRIEVRGDDAISDKSGGRRIFELAKLRNEVMQPLYDGSAARAVGVEEFERVLFMNDIIFCAADILEILYEHENQGADMTCSLDWGSHVIYDRWAFGLMDQTAAGVPFPRSSYSPEDLFPVLTSFCSLGFAFPASSHAYLPSSASRSPTYAQSDLTTYFYADPPESAPVPQPLTSDPLTLGHLTRLEPFQVFSCWNGAVVLPAAAFVSGVGGEALGEQDQGDARGTGQGAVRFRTAKNDESEVTERQSECFILPVDLWKRGMGRIQVVPRASVSYTGYDYDEVRQDGRRGRGREAIAPHPAGLAYVPLPSTPAENEAAKIKWVLDPPAQVVYHDYAWWHAPENADWFLLLAEVGCMGRGIAVSISSYAAVLGNEMHPLWSESPWSLRLSDPSSATKSEGGRGAILRILRIPHILVHSYSWTFAHHHAHPSGGYLLLDERRSDGEGVIEHSRWPGAGTRSNSARVDDFNEDIWVDDDDGDEDFSLQEAREMANGDVMEIESDGPGV